MANSGRMIYVPKDVLDRLFNIKKKNKIVKNKDAWNKMGRLVDVGMNVDDFYNDFFGFKREK